MTIVNNDNHLWGKETRINNGSNDIINSHLLVLPICQTL